MVLAEKVVQNIASKKDIEEDVLPEPLGKRCRRYNPTGSQEEEGDRDQQRECRTAAKRKRSSPQI